MVKIWSLVWAVHVWQSDIISKNIVFELRTPRLPQNGHFYEKLCKKVKIYHALLTS